MTEPPLPDAVAERLRAADDLPWGQARLQTLDEAARIADTLRDVAAGYAVRRRLIDEAAYCLRYDLYAVAFAWCLGTARRQPDRFSAASLLGHYQNVIGKMVNFPDVSREQFESLFADVLGEFQTHGFSVRALHLLRRSVAIDFGDRDMAVAADREWRKYPRDDLSRSAEFELLEQVHHDNFLADDAAAGRHAAEYFARPHRPTHLDPSFAAETLLPLLRLGRRPEADARVPTASRGHTTGYVWSRGHLLEYLGRTAVFSAGLREFERQLPSALAQPDPLSRFYCLRPAALLFDRMRAAGVRSVPLPSRLPCADPSGVSEPAAVRA